MRIFSFFQNFHVETHENKTEKRHEFDLCVNRLMPPTTSRKSRSMTEKFQILANEFSTENDNHDSPRTAE